MTTLSEAKLSAPMSRFLVDAPEANADPVKVGDVWLQYKVCPDSCCKVDKKGIEPKTKHRWFIFDKDMKPLSMTVSWESMCKLQGWA